MAGTALDHHIISGERVLPGEILVVETFLVLGLDESLERAARMVTFDVFLKKPRAAAKYINLKITQ